MIYRGPAPAVPAGFRDTFLAGGYKAVERRYGTSNSKIMQWIDACGRQELLAARRAVQPCGRKAGGRG